MKETGILFSGVMQQAIAAGNKTMTRRIIKPQPDDANDFDIFTLKERCRYGKPGDLLYIRESWFPVEITGNKVLIGYDVNNANDTHEITVSSQRLIYYWDKMGKGRVISSRFMPKEVARKWLLIKEIRAEQLQDISRADAVREGVESEFDTYRDYSQRSRTGSFVFTNPIDSFRTLWELVNGPGSWEANPYVFTIGFKQCNK